VNRLVKIIHQVGTVWDAKPTNNYGDRYILLWHLPQEASAKKGTESVVSGEEGQEKEAKLGIKSPRPDAPWMKEEVDEFEKLKDEEIPKKREEIADKALISAVKTIAEIERDAGLLAYSRHPRIQTKFENNYKTQISFGLHTGISIEGSIGTEMKMDYLNISMDAQIALRINELSDKYDTQILMSGDMYDMLS